MPGFTFLQPPKQIFAMETTEEDGQTYFYIHWIDVTAPSGKEAGDAIKGTLEKGLRRVWQ